jgi:hypothetical protein
VASMITTSDNPFDPFDEWDQWFTWDMVHGYNTPGLLARILVTSDSLSEADQEADREAAIDEIVQENINGLYVKVTR